jgi:hypothetical protein
MVWAGICHGVRTQPKIVQGTLNAVIYRDDILDPVVLSFLQQRNFDNVFQHDNARCHVDRVCQDFLNQNHFRVLPLPAFSPDLSPIEHLWDDLEVSLLQKGQNDRIKNIVSVYYGIQCSLNNFGLSANTMTNSSPDHNTSASKTVGLVHTLVRKMFPTPAVNTITSIAKTK